MNLPSKSMKTPKARTMDLPAPQTDTAAPPPALGQVTSFASEPHVQRFLSRLEEVVQTSGAGRQNALEVEVARLSIELARLRHSMEPVHFLGDAARLLTGARRALAEEEQRPQREQREHKAQFFQTLAESELVPWAKIFRPGPAEGGTARQDEHEEFECSAGFDSEHNRETVRFKWHVVTSRKGWLKLLARHFRYLYQPTAKKIENLYGRQGLGSLDTAARQKRAERKEGRTQGGQSQDPTPSGLAFQKARELIEGRVVSDELLGQLRAVQNQTQAADWAKRWLMASKPEVIAHFDRLAQGGKLGAATLHEMSISRRNKKP